jgi:hypothetical protein
MCASKYEDGQPYDPGRPSFGYKPLKPGQIRLLRLLRSKTNDLSYELIHDNLDSKKSYSALSYRWGKAENTHDIKVDGSIFPISKNLHKGLEQLHGHKPNKKDSDSVYEFLWVDAICINQGTSPAACKERSIQITLMKRIYEQAKTVLVWLGNPENETNNCLAFQKMNDIYARFRQTQKKNRTYRPWWWPHAPERTEDDVFKTMASISADDRSLFDVEGSETHKAWLGILSLWRNPWWTRTWVYQEATIPEDYTMFYIAGVTVRPIKCKVKFLCGNEMGSWSTLARAMTVADHLQAMPSIDTSFMRGAQEPFRRLLAFRQKRIQSIPQSLLDLLQFFRRTECQDPRDKVYSPLCLAPPESQAFMAPDYLGKNTLDVYLEVAKFSLTQPDRQLDFLGFAVWLPEVPRPPPPDLPSASFPTWLPNWFQPVDIIPIPKTMFVLKPSRSKALRPYDRRSIPKNDEDEVQSYKATPSTPCPVRILSLRLHLRAIYVDTIADIMPLNNGPSGIATTKERGFEWGKASAGRYPINGETFVSAMKRTEVLDMNYDWQGRACSRGATLDWAFLNKPRDQLTNEEYEAQWTMQIAFNSGTRGRNLGLTGRGFLGMIPQGAVVGDRVFAFLGGSVLYTVRCLGEGDGEGVFMYIGETYLHGWMDGEVMELVDRGEAKIEDVVLV